MSLNTNIQNLAVRAATEAKSLRTLVNGNVSDLTALSTTAQGNLVSAINELYSSIQAQNNGDLVSTNNLSDITDASAVRTNIDVSSTGEIAADIAAGLATITLGALGGLTQAEVDVRVQQVVGAAPGALDTLNELAAALGDDPNFATTITTALDNRLRFDAEQTLNATQLQQAQDNLSVFSRTEIGSVTTNYVTIFNSNLL